MHLYIYRLKCSKAISGWDGMGIYRLKCSKAISGWDGMGSMEISVSTSAKSTALQC